MFGPHDDLLKLKDLYKACNLPKFVQSLEKLVKVNKIQSEISFSSFSYVIVHESAEKKICFEF